ncbi:MAG: PEP/pyruvate-binding domain-containing protein [Nitrospirota bacterium]
MFNFFKKGPAGTPREPDRGELFRKKYRTFQELLAHNNTVLELMADMEEKLSGDFLFDRQYINRTVDATVGGVRSIVNSLNALSGSGYSLLHERLDTISAAISSALSRTVEIPVSSYTVPLDEITRDMAAVAGGKIANMGEIRNRLRVPTPGGFVITTYAYKRFMEHNGFFERIHALLSDISLSDVEVLDRTSRDIQEMVTGGTLPGDLLAEISGAVTRLCSGRESLRVSVRSSALQEDGEFSFAGQYATFLNVPCALVVQKYKEVIASLFTPRALFYYKTKGFSESDMAMAVGVLPMIEAQSGGVMYSLDPNNPDRDTVIISAIMGLGKCVVEGIVTPETYILSKHPEPDIVEKKIPLQETMLLCRPDGGLDEILVPAEMRGKPSLSDIQVKTLAHYALILERHYRYPQDIEWALDKNFQPYILQTRPLRVFTGQKAKPVPPRIKGYHVLIDKGVIACKGIGIGRAHIVRSDEDLASFPEGAVLVARHTSTKFVTVMNRASAIITDVGGVTGHMASLAREFQVPAILDTENATEVVSHGQEITVDAFNCNVYEGRVSELVDFVDRREDPLKDTQLFRTLERVLKLIVPLNLVDPEADNFTPEHCATLHDITRFAHEKGMYEMFTISDASDVKRGAGVRLVAGIPTDIYVLDLGGGIEETAQGLKKIMPSHVTSIPLQAFLKGLTSMRWPDAAPLDAKGFMGMIAHTATIPEADLAKAGENSFIFISNKYMNFALRLGYHLSTVEAYAGDTVNNNYIKFFFKGGGAVRDRRMRRVRLITELLKEMDFTVTVTDDIIDAMLTKYKRSTIEGKLEVLGRLTAYTKQLDMVMYNDAVTDMYINEFISKYLRKPSA